MSEIRKIKNPWRDLLLSKPASFRDVIFHVETGTRTSGRRVVVHEYPKRNLDKIGGPPYTEDMGRHARRFAFSGYLIYKPESALGNLTALGAGTVRYNYVIQRVRLIKALEENGAGALFHPVFLQDQGPIQAVCERYSMVESRERGGYTQFEMQFVEEGTAGNSVVKQDTANKTNKDSTIVDQAAVDNLSVDALSAYETGSQPIKPNAEPFEPTIAERHVIDSGINY